MKQATIPEHQGNLPTDGERLTFGVHRLPEQWRRCAAWPRAAEVNPHPKTGADVLAYIRNLHPTKKVRGF